MKLIISGVPCCGKTHFGDWLRDEHAFAHANLEQRAGAIPMTPPNMSENLPAWLGSLGAKVVVTWGFPPNETCLKMIARFRDAGFTPWWFNADQAVARARYTTLYGNQKTQKLFDPQMVRIAQAKPDLDGIYQGHTIQTLSNEGYTSTEEIYASLTADLAQLGDAANC
jgi:hypothetical protein